MTRKDSLLATWLVRIRRTPIHPQWLLGARLPPRGTRGVSGWLLDIGAADRWLERHMHAGVHYVALDHPTTGRDRYGSRPDVFGDGARLPFMDECFDTVCCLEVLEHVREPAALMSEMARVLRPGGTVCLSMPFLYPIHDAPHDYQRYTEAGLRREFERAGLGVVDLRRSGSAVRAAGLLAALAVAGGVRGLGKAGLLLYPVAAALVFGINCMAWVLDLVWPRWTAMAPGYEVEGRKP